MCAYTVVSDHIPPFYKPNDFAIYAVRYNSESVFISLENKSSVADPERFDSDLDPTFNVEADPDLNFY